MLVLPIKKKWFDMIKSGEKKEEYREIKTYWFVRFKNNLEVYEYDWLGGSVEIRKEDNYLVKKVYLKNINDDKNFYQIHPLTRIIELTRLDGELDDTLYDLIKADLVEKTR